MNQYTVNNDSDILNSVHAPAKWPGVIGTTSVVLGSLGILCNTCFASFGLLFQGMLETWMRSLPTQPGAPANRSPAAAADAMAVTRPWMMAQGLIALLSVALAAWLLVAGISMLKRKPASAGMHRAWAWSRLAVAAVGLCVGLAQTFLTSERVASITASTAQAEIAKGLAMTAVGTVIVAAYPVIVLAVLSRPWAKDEVARWRAEGLPEDSETL
ncbi:MAG TPA: hypothetical protein VEB22_09435 [Phycisphaerales bacterium]|nr:hypothetical protein [Phycisphaerales bacterium]